MDLGIAGKRAIICGASKGLGKACAEALAREGVKITIAARHLAQLAETAEEIRKETGNRVTAVVADVTTAEGRQAVLAACNNPDILITNSGGPPAGDFRDWNEVEWHQAVQNNMITHILMIKAVVDGMIDRRWGRIVNVTSAAVKSPYPSLGLSNGARAGLTGFVAGLSREVAKYNVTINNLLPGSHETDRLIKLTEADARARRVHARHRRSRRPRRRRPAAASARRRSSARSRRSCAASMPATSSGRTSWSTGDVSGHAVERARGLRKGAE